MNLKKILRPLYWELKCFSFRSIKYRIHFKSCGMRLKIGHEVYIRNPHMVSVGRNVTIEHHTSLFINPIGGTAEIIIGDNVILGKYNDFGCSNKIIIGNDVITAPFVHITDRDHSYEDITVPIMYQSANSKGAVVIKDGTWLGFGVQIMSGVTIGKQSVIAAGSIVTKDIPDYCVAVGNPARVIKKYNLDTQKWEKC